MEKLQKFKVALRESERWFRVIFKQTFGYIGLMEPIDIFIKGNQAALTFAGITSWDQSNSSSFVGSLLRGLVTFRTVEISDRQQDINTGLAIVKKIVKVLKFDGYKCSSLWNTIYDMQLSPRADDGGLFTHLQLF